MASIKATTTRNFRENFKRFADDVSDYGDTLLITRPNRKNVVLISEDEFNSWQETNYLLASQANREALRRGINSTHPAKVLTPVEWDEMVAEND